jgi:hypothetical protein
MLNTYRDVIVAEGDFNNQERPATALTEDEQEQLCGSLKTVSSPLSPRSGVQTC